MSKASSVATPYPIWLNRCYLEEALETNDLFPNIDYLYSILIPMETESYIQLETSDLKSNLNQHSSVWQMTEDGIR